MARKKKKSSSKRSAKRVARRIRSVPEEPKEPSFAHLTRQLDLIPLVSLAQPITVIGAGAVGSFAVLSLAKMGFTDITVYDFDTVSVENMNSQWFRFSDIDIAKVAALAETIETYTNTKIKARNQRWTGLARQQLSGIVITAVDSMKVRQDVWNHIKGRKQVSWLIDPRMAAESALSFTMNPNDPEDQASYEKTLYTDEAAVQERCTAKATMYTSTMLAGYVAKQVKDLVTGEPYARVTHWDIKRNVLRNWGKKREQPDDTGRAVHGIDKGEPGTLRGDSEQVVPASRIDRS